MNLIKSLIFYLYLISISLVYSIAMFATFWISFRWRFFLCHITSCMARLGVRFILGIKFEIKGLENLDKNKKYIIACKHESALETIVLNSVFKQNVFILKKSLYFIPILGQAFIPVSVAIGRKNLRQDLKDMEKGAEKFLNKGASVCIFPEGTRAVPNTKKEIKSGLFALCKKFENKDVYILPVALNTGNFWGRNSFNKKSGIATIKIHKDIALKNLDKNKFNKIITDKINDLS